MRYDLYVECPQGNGATQLQLLVTRANTRALEEYVLLVHGKYDKKSKQLTSPASLNAFISEEIQRLRALGLENNTPDFSLLPPGSWFLRFTFTLAKPWISKDDDPFYVTESVNPVRKDKVFKVPVMSAASWKGLLRWTMMQTRLFETRNAKDWSDERWAKERFAQWFLFGDEKGEEPDSAKDFAAYLDTLKPRAKALFRNKVREYFELDAKDELPHQSGRLMFYPTFFDLIEVEVINPHSRKTKAGTHPIYLECVPAGARGTFSLLYVPFDLIGKDAAETRQQAVEDLLRVAEGLQAMFTLYGFSAKRTSGYGVAEESLQKGTFQLRVEEIAPLPAAQPPAPTQPLPGYLSAPGKLKDEYLNPDGSFRERSESELKAMKKSDRQQYEKAKKWWEREGKDLSAKPLAPHEPLPKTAPRWLKREFESFAQLRKKAEEVAQVLENGGAA